MFVKLVVSALLLALTWTSVQSDCPRDRNVQIKNPTYLNYGDGFFYMWDNFSNGDQVMKFFVLFSQGLSNGESVVMYKHPDDSRVFGQYTFKDEKCLFETVYYYVVDGKFEFTSKLERVIWKENFLVTIA